MCSDQTELDRFIAETYGLAVSAVTPAKRGFFGETWRVQCGAAAYFVKIDYWEYHQELFRRSLPVIEFMTGSGISFVPAVVKTRAGLLSCDFHSGVLAVFPFIEGENTEDYPIGRLFDHLSQLYKLDSAGLTLEVEAFDAGILQVLEELRARLPREHAAAHRVREILRQHSGLLDRYADRLRLFAARCAADRSGFCLTHGDAGGNCILEGDRFTIIDWDQLKRAPIERDAWFFMHVEQQVDEIHSALRRSGLDYTLSTDRFGYYCYFSFFNYLTEYLKSFLSVQTESNQLKCSEGIEQFFSSWIFTQLAAADKL